MMNQNEMESKFEKGEMVRVALEQMKVCHYDAW